MEVCVMYGKIESPYQQGDSFKSTLQPYLILCNKASLCVTNKVFANVSKQLKKLVKIAANLFILDIFHVLSSHSAVLAAAGWCRCRGWGWGRQVGQQLQDAVVAEADLGPAHDAGQREAAVAAVRQRGHAAQPPVDALPAEHVGTLRTGRGSSAYYVTLV